MCIKYIDIPQCGRIPPGDVVSLERRETELKINVPPPVTELTHLFILYLFLLYCKYYFVHILLDYKFIL